MARRAGGFGTAFSQAFAAMMNAVETQRHNRALEDHWARVDGKQTPSEIEAAAVGKARGEGMNSYDARGGGGAGGGSASVSKNLGANQQEAYGAARQSGLSDGAARALVANMSGEALADPSNVHKDGPHMAHGIVQWDDVRTAAIEKQFGKPPQQMSVADQTKAAIWEMKTNPAYKDSWNALNSGASPQDMVKTLVTNYERPGNPAVSITQRLAHLGNLPTNMDAGTAAPATAAATPTKGPLAGKAAKAADVPAANAQPVEMTSGAGGKFKVPGSGELVEGPTPAPAAPALGAPLPAPGAQQPNDIASLPRYGTGPADTGDPSGRMIPPAGGAPSMGYPALQPGPANVAPSPAPQATINPETDKSPVNMGPNQPGDTGARPDLVARSPAIPSQATVQASAPQPATPAPPAQDPRFVQVTAPNSGPNDRNRPQMTALNLWGSNPPVAQRQAAPPVTPQSNVRRPDDDLSGVTPSAPNMDDVSLGMQLGAAKGGAIRRYAAGGAIPGYATAGPVSSAYPSYTPAAPAPTPGLQGNVLAATQWMNSLPGMTQVDTGNSARGYYTSYGPGSFNGQGGQQILSNYGKLTPDQVTQYNAMINGTWVPPADPTPAAPAPVAAPPPVVQPTITQVNPVNPTVNTLADTTTTGQPVTGAFNLPNTVAPKTPKFTNPDTGESTNDKASQSTGSTDYSVGTDDALKQNNTQSGFAQGGAIPSRPTMRYAGGSAVMNAMNSPNYVGPTLQGGWSGTPYAQLAPNQQAWATTQQGLLGQELNAAHADAAYWGGGGKSMTGPQDTMQYWNQMTTMPDAVWPTSTPAAPAPLNQPAPSITQVNPAAKTPDLSADTTTTAGPVTGAFNLPNTVMPKTPNFINPDTGESKNDPATQNVGGTDYTVSAKGDTSQNVAQPGGFQRGGAIPKTAFDDGGGVSPAAAGGMPPGLGGSSPIPPIYFNSATYSGAGAPVGKGISTNSAPTTVAGAIPSLPMVKGGAVGFDDGGAVDDDTGMPAGEEMGPASGNARQAAPAPAPTTAPAAAPVTPQSNYASATDPQQVHPDLPAWTPQIKDDQGNPSKGVVGAIAGGLHYLASQLGLSGGGGQQPAIAQDPNTSANRTSFANGQGVTGAPMPSQADIHTLHSAMGTDGLSSGMRNLAGMEAVRNYYLVQGEPDKADKMAASMMQYSVSLAQQHGDEAAKRYYDGDLKGAVDQLNHASEAIADGNDYKAELSPDGKHVVLSNRDLNGREVWKAKVAPQEILSAALGMKDGSLAWSAYEAQAAKYDPATAQMIRDRNQQKTWQHQQDVTDATAKAKQDAADAQAKGLTGVLEGMHRPRGAIPATPGAAPVLSSPSMTRVPDQAPTSADQGAAPSPSPQGSAPAAAPPTDADQAGVTAAPPTTGGAIPSGPTAALPAAQPSEPPPTRPDEVEGYASLAPAQANEAWKTYQAEYIQWHQNQADQQREGRMDRREAFTQDQLNQREKFTQESQARASADHDARTAAAEQEKVRLARVSPMDERTLQSKFDTNPDPTTGAVGKEPADWLAATPLYSTDAQGNKIDLATAKQNMAKDFGSTGNMNRVNEALINTQRMNSHMNTDQVADFVTGVAKGTYQFSADPKPITDAWGSRYSIAYARPDGSMGALLVPEDDMNNIIRIRQGLAKQGKDAASTSAAAASPYAGPAIPPAPRRAPSPTTGQESGPTVRPGMVTGAPAPTTNPVGAWWGRMLNPPPMARGRGYNASP